MNIRFCIVPKIILDIIAKFCDQLTLVCIKVEKTIILIKDTSLAQFFSFEFKFTRRQQHHYNMTKNKVTSLSKPTLKKELLALKTFYKVYNMFSR